MTLSPPNRTRSDVPKLVLTGLLGFLIAGVVSCCALTAYMIAPAFRYEMPRRPTVSPAEPDLTVIVTEAFLDRALTAVLPERLSEGASLDIQDDDRLVISSRLTILMQRVDVVVSLRMAVQAGELELVMESVEAGGRDVMDLIDVDWGALGRRMSRVVQGHVDAGLGSDARVLGVRMEEDRVIITVSRSPQDSSTSQEESTPKSRRRG